MPGSSLQDCRSPGSLIQINIGRPDAPNHCSGELVPKHLCKPEDPPSEG